MKYDKHMNQAKLDQQISLTQELVRLKVPPKKKITLARLMVLA